MKNLAGAVETFFSAATRNPQGDKYLVEPDPLGFAESRDHVFQFDIEDGEPFYLTINNKKVTVKEGKSSLDWQGKDWGKLSPIWTDKETLKAVVLGETDPITEWHRGRWDFASRIGNSPYHSWFCILLPMAREQLTQEQVKAFLTKELDKGLGAALGSLLAAIKNHPEGVGFLTEPDIVRDADKIEKWEHTFQFEPEDGSPFYAGIGGGDIKITEGVCPLDWRVKDWERCTRVWSDTGVLSGVILGEKNTMTEWHEGRWDFSSRIASSHYHSWFIIIMRMAREQLAKDVLRQYLF